MAKNPFKGRIIRRLARGKISLPKMEQPLIERPSLKGRIHKLPKTAFWQRMGGWPLIDPLTKEGA